MLPASDVKFLQSVVQRLSERRLHVYAPGTHRSSVALILRFGDRDQRALSRVVGALVTESAQQRGGDGGPRPSSTGTGMPGRGLLSSFMDDRARSGADTSVGGVSGSFQAREAAAVVRAMETLASHVDPSLPSSLRLLFMKRRDVSADRWSGQVSFPGGPRDPDDVDDRATVCREVYEVLGLPLHSREFLCLGRLPDFETRSRVVHQQGTVVARFVFLHVGDMTPTVQIADHEVDSVRWMPLARLHRSFVTPDSVVHPFMSFIQTEDADRRLILSELFPGALVAFPSISMPDQGDSGAGGEGGPATAAAPNTSDEDVGPHSGVRASPSASRHPGEPHRLPPWRVWGLTLRCASELIMLDDRAVLDWPLFSSNSTLLQHTVINAFHGYYEVCFQYYRLRAWIRYGVRQVGAPASTRWGRIARSEPTPVPSPTAHRAQQAYRDYMFGGPNLRRRATLPASAPSLLFAVPETPNVAHVGFFCLDVGIVLALVYGVAALLYAGFTVFRVALGLETAPVRERWRAGRREGPVGRAAVVGGMESSSVAASELAQAAGGAEVDAEEHRQWVGWGKAGGGDAGSVHTRAVSESIVGTGEVSSAVGGPSPRAAEMPATDLMLTKEDAETECEQLPSREPVLEYSAQANLEEIMSRYRR